MYTVHCMYCLNTANTRKCVYYVYYSIPRTMHCPHSLHCPALVSLNYVYYSTVLYSNDHELRAFHENYLNQEAYILCIAVF
jgi:hypothetical protein